MELIQELPNNIYFILFLIGVFGFVWNGQTKKAATQKNVH